MKRTTRIIAVLLCAIMMMGIIAGCQNQDPTGTQGTTNPTGTTNPSGTTAPVEQNWKDAYTDAQIAEFYNTAIKIGYTEDFKYTTKGYTVGSGEDAEQVV